MVQQGIAPIQIDRGTFTWDLGKATRNLTDVSLELPQGSLVAVVGSTGSGKSSLLSAVLGEMPSLTPGTSPRQALGGLVLTLRLARMCDPKRTRCVRAARIVDIQRNAARECHFRVATR